MRILIADDDTTSRLLLTATLKKLGHTVTSVDDGRAALQAWREGHHAIVISDWMMPELDGLDLCRAIRGEPALQYTYFVLLTSLKGKERYLDGMHAGADDFLSKPYDEDYLTARLHVAERIIALHEALHFEATHDRLTGLWNRAAILDSLQQELEHGARHGSRTGIVVADVDRFKCVNDTYGHAVGDQVLREVAQRMRACLRPADRIGRYGGEEFLIHLRDCDGSDALAIAESIRSAISAQPIQTPAGCLTVTASLGVAVTHSSQPESPGTLINAADDALYRAKEGGRDRAELAASL